jgi:hypothetical protein
MKKTKGERGNSREDKGAAASIEADLNIPPELREIVDDSDDDFPLKFKDHNELIDIFSTLEENNLLEIQRMQESEQELEMKRQQKNKTEFDFANIIAILEANEATNVARIGRTQQEKDALSGFTEDGEGQSLEDNLRNRMEENTQKLYVTAKDIEVRTNDPEYTKLIS